MVTDHTTMQYGHNAPIRYRLWKISQWMNTTPSSGPDRQPTQYQCGRANSGDCEYPGDDDDGEGRDADQRVRETEHRRLTVTITEPQDSTGLMLQDGT